MSLEKNASKIIVALVKIYDVAPAEITEPGFELDIWDLAVKAKILTQQDADKRKEEFLCGRMDDLPSITNYMKERGWVHAERRDHVVALWPTPAGIDYARQKMRSPVQRLGSYVQAHIGEIATAAVTAIITTIVTNLIQK